MLSAPSYRILRANSSDADGAVRRIKSFYFSPTGCTFWGKKPWTRKKKLLWQIGTLIGAPVAIALIAGLAIPGIIFGVPVFVGRY